MQSKEEEKKGTLLMKSTVALHTHEGLSTVKNFLFL